MMYICGGLLYERLREGTALEHVGQRPAGHVLQQNVEIALGLGGAQISDHQTQHRNQTPASQHRERVRVEQYLTMFW